MSRPPGGTPVYLDHAATTPVDPRVAEAMSRHLTAEGIFGNPSSATHAYGREAAAALAAARADVAALVGAEPEGIVFTSGATEADNLAIFGVAEGRAGFGRHLVTQATEHKAVLDALRRLQKRGFEVTVLPTDGDGRVDPRRLAAALRPDTQLVTIMHGNNETGVLQDVATLAGVCRDRGVLLHVDAAQSAGRVPLDVGALGVGLMSISAHKMYGPKGIGALYVAPSARPWLEPLLAGGAQERGLRPGTVPLHQVAGFAAAARIARAQRDADAARLGPLAARLEAMLVAAGSVRVNGAAAPRLPGFLSISFEGVDGESLVAGLPGLAVASGAACDSASSEPSHVLRALGLGAELAQATLRLSLGRHTTEAEVEFAAAAILAEVQRLRALAPPLEQGGAAAEPGDGSWVHGDAGRRRDGAHVRFHLRFDAQGRVLEARFQAYGCPWTLAAAEWVTARLAGRAVGDLVPGTPSEWAAGLGVPSERLGRLFVVEDALRAAGAALNCV